jgi:hypothetical protein
MKLTVSRASAANALRPNTANAINTATFSMVSPKGEDGEELISVALDGETRTQTCSSISWV